MSVEIMYTKNGNVCKNCIHNSNVVCLCSVFSGNAQFPNMFERK